MFISGIQQIGLGVSDVHAAFDWYRRTLGFDLPVFEEAAEAALMLPYTGGEPRSRHAILALNIQGGGGLEIWQYTSRTPEGPKQPIELGDLGIFSMKIKCKDPKVFCEAMQKKGEAVLSHVDTAPDGRSHFFMRDPWGNILELIEFDDWFSDVGFLTGGVCGCTIGVRDMDASLKLYQEVLGYDTLVYDQTNGFDDYLALPKGRTPFRRVLLRHGQKRKGPFSRLLGDSEIELVQRIDKGGTNVRQIFEGRMWGDLGYIHLCFDITGMQELREKCAAFGQAFTVDSSDSFDMGAAAGHFSYIEDADGTLIEFVETHKVPILKKIGWYLNLRKRSNPEKALPRFLVKAMGLNRKK